MSGFVHIYQHTAVVIYGDMSEYTTVDLVYLAYAIIGIERGKTDTRGETELSEMSDKPGKSP